MRYNSSINTEPVLKEFSYASKELKKQMGNGPWQEEDDFFQFKYNHPRIDTYLENRKPIVVTPGSNILCLISRGASQSWNGYAGVGKDSPLFEMSSSELYKRVGWNIPVHGGITFSGKIIPFQRKEKRPHSILRYVHQKRGRPRKMWFFGFDCAHTFDLLPNEAYYSYRRASGSVYRTQEFAIQEASNLAAFLLKVETALKQNHPGYVY